MIPPWLASTLTIYMTIGIYARATEVSNWTLSAEEPRMRYKVLGNRFGLRVSEPASGRRRPALRVAPEPNHEEGGTTESVTIGNAAAPPAPGLPRHWLRRLGLVAVALAIIACAAWLGHSWWTVGRYIETTDDAYIGGNVTAIAPHVSGFVAQVLAADNEHVHKGQVLVRLDPRDFQTALDHAAAVVAARTTEVEGLRARYTLQQSVIRQYEADRAAKEARASFTAQDAERYRDLARTNAVSRQEAQRSSTLDQEARAAVSSSGAALESARQQLKVLEAQIAAARATEAQARSDLQ